MHYHPVLASLGRADRVLRGPGLEESEWDPGRLGVQVQTEDESKSQNLNFRTDCGSGTRVECQCLAALQS